MQKLHVRSNSSFIVAAEESKRMIDIGPFPTACLRLDCCSFCCTLELEPKSILMHLRAGIGSRIDHYVKGELAQQGAQVSFILVLSYFILIIIHFMYAPIN